MSHFTCDKCGKPIIDSPKGYVTGCEHYPMEVNMLRHYHVLKSEKRFFQDELSGKKQFTIRKNDRNYQVGDIVYLKETEDGVYTGRRDPLGHEIKYIFHGGQYGLEEGYCVFNW